MSACFVFDPVAWEHPLARWTLETLAAVTELRWRAAPVGERVGEAEAPVFVGPEPLAPADAAAVIAFEHWPEWDPDTLMLADVAGVPLPCPRGMLQRPAPAAPVPLGLGAAGPGIAAGPAGAALVPRVFPPEWLRAVGFMLAREEEFLSDRRDEWECFKGTYSRLHELGVLDEPLVNRCARQLERRVLAWHEARGRTAERVPRWKRGARFAVALTHDVDDVARYSLRGALRLLKRAQRPTAYAVRGGLTAVARALGRAGRRDPYDQFDRWVTEEEQRGFRSSFYFVPPDASRAHEYDPTYAWSDPVTFEGRRTTVGAMLRRLLARGFEVGLHGSYMSHRDADEIQRQKRSVERAAEHEVAGGRQHFLRFDVRATWTAQERAALRYDSTLGYNEAIGFRAGIAAPFRPWDPERRAARDLIEAPLTVMDGALFRSLGLDGPHAIARTREHLERVEEAGGLAVLLWHPNAAAEALFPGWWSCFHSVLEWLASRHVWVASAAEIAEWWREREARQRM